MRVRILEVLTEWGPLSPTQIVLSGVAADIESLRSKKTHKKRLSHVDYHMRVLEEAEFVTLVGQRPVRGATEHFYETDYEAVFSDEEWAVLPKDERQSVSGVMWRRFIPQVEAAMQADTFDSRLDRMLAWGPMSLDEEGWRRLAKAYAEFWGEIEGIKGESEGRLEDSGEDPIRAIYGMFAFEAPQPQRLMMPDGLQSWPPGIDEDGDGDGDGERSPE
jgi:hypothetical protein